MSEYWKSTPKYWCKHCKTYVRDTKLEKTNHDATPKHQGNIKRFLRDLHRGHEREERDKQRAKSEVDRLNGVISGNITAIGSAEVGAPWRRKPAIPPSNIDSGQATPADRKRQLAQLAEMGVAIPEEFRREMAMAGDWQVLSEKPVREFEKREKEEYKDIKPDAMGIGVRKRKHNGQDEEEEEVEDTMVRKGWGSTARTYPNLTSHDDELDFLLGKSTETRQKVGLGTDTYMDSSKMILEDQPTHNEAESISGSTLETPSIKQETSDNTECLMSSMLNAGNGEGPPIKQENSSLEPRILFKKRKSKPIRNK